MGASARKRTSTISRLRPSERPSHGAHKSDDAPPEIKKSRSCGESHAAIASAAFAARTDDSSGSGCDACIAPSGALDPRGTTTSERSTSRTPEAIAAAAFPAAITTNGPPSPSAARTRPARSTRAHAARKASSTTFFTSPMVTLRWWNAASLRARPRRLRRAHAAPRAGRRERRDRRGQGCSARRNGGGRASRRPDRGARLRGRSARRLRRRREVPRHRRLQRRLLGRRRDAVSPASSIPQCPSVVATDTTIPRCNHVAGDDSSNPSGTGCDVEDLCEPGFHVCTSSADVAKHSPSGCDGATLSGDPPLFFVTRQSSNGCGMCATGTSTGPQCDSKSCTTGCAETERTSNDAFGCGNVAPQVQLQGCDPLDSFTNNFCDDLNGSSWSCSADPSGFCEAYVLSHLDATFGGALCCRD